MSKFKERREGLSGGMILENRVQIGGGIVDRFDRFIVGLPVHQPALAFLPVITFRTVFVFIILYGADGLFFGGTGLAHVGSLHFFKQGLEFGAQSEFEDSTG